MAEYLEASEQQKSRAYSPAVITQGGRTVWLAGQTATRDEQGNDISGNFEAQVLTVFSLIDKTLKRTGGSLANMVTMTVFIIDPRHGDRFVEMRRGFFPDGNFPWDTPIIETANLPTLPFTPYTTLAAFQAAAGANYVAPFSVGPNATFTMDPTKWYGGIDVNDNSTIIMGDATYRVFDFTAIGYVSVCPFFA